MNPLGIYVHWPFCLSKCPYCDFNSHVRARIDEEAWAEALLQDLHHARSLSHNHQCVSVFFGGGTPSLMSASTVGKVIRTIDKLWGLNEGTEITLEANPNSIEAEKFKDFKAAGINRISMGIQSLRDDQLKFLGRTHGRAEALKAISIASDIFERYSFDLIYARPQQALKEWKAELSEALSLANGHLSLYQLTIEPQTAFAHAYRRGELKLPSEEISAELYELTGRLVGEKGYKAYEISNYAREGQECRHNMVYWRYQDYVGVGPGAHGRLTRQGKKIATKAYRAPETWLENVKKSAHGLEVVEDLTPFETLQELVLMGLRLREGIQLKEAEKILGVPLVSQLNQKALTEFQADNLLELNETSLKTTPRGSLYLNYIIEKLL